MPERIKWKAGITEVVRMLNLNMYVIKGPPRAGRQARFGPSLDFGFQFSKPPVNLCTSHVLSLQFLCTELVIQSTIFCHIVGYIVNARIIAS